MKHLIIPILLVVILSLVASVAVAEVPQVTGKILLYLTPNGYNDMLLIVVNDTAVYYRMHPWPGRVLVTYDPANNVLTIISDGSFFSGFDDIRELSFMGFAYPLTYISALPNLESVTIKYIQPSPYKTGTVTVRFAELGVSIERTTYEGYSAVKISTGKETVIYRDDGVLLAALWVNWTVYKLVAEDDMAKKVSPTPVTTTPPSSSTTPLTSSTPTPSASSTSPSVTSITETGTPTTPVQPATPSTAKPATTTSPQEIPTTTTTTPQKTIGIEYIVAGAVAAIAVVAILTFIVRKR